MMLSYVISPNGLPLVLFIWRSQEEGDYSEIEKQRLALFMRYLSSFIRVKSEFLHKNSDDNIKEFGNKYSLTNTEIEILSNLLNGHSLREISKETSRSYRTVRWHVRNLLEKCQVKSQKNLLSEFYKLIKH